MAGLRVAHISPTFFGRDSILGGAERSVMQLSRTLATRVPTTLVTFSAGLTRLKVEHEGSLELRYYPAKRFVRGNRANPIAAAFLEDLRTFDFLHCHSYPSAITDLTILFAKVFRKKVLLTDHHCGGVTTSTYLVKLGVDTRRFFDGFLLYNAYNAQQYRQYRNRVYIVGNGVDVSHFRPLGIPRERRVLFVGRLVPIKGVDYLIESMDRATPVHIVGPIYDQDYYRELVDMAKGKNVEFRTDASEADLISEYSSAMVTVVPSVYKDRYGSKGPGELLGNVALESMACGTPVIATRCGGLADVVADGITGFLVPPNEPGALRERIQFLLEHPDRAAAMGQAARERVLQCYRWDAVADRYLQAYGEIWQPRKAHGA